MSQGYRIEPLPEEWQTIDREFRKLCQQYPKCTDCQNYNLGSPNFCLLYPIWSDDQIYHKKQNLTPYRLEKWYIKNKLAGTK